MQVVPRPHRPPTPSVIPQDSTPVGKQDKKDGKCVILKVYVQSTLCQMGIIGPGIECLSKGTYHLSWITGWPDHSNLKDNSTIIARTALPDR